MGARANKLALKLTVSFVVASLFIGMGPFSTMKVAAAQLLSRSMQVSSDQAAATNVQYNTSFSIATAGTLGSIELQFCSNSPLQGDVCIIPAGFDASSATLTAQSGQTGFSVSTSSTANNVILTRPPAPSGTGMTNYELSGVTNPGSGGSLFARIITYASSDASGPPIDFGGIALSIQGGLSISLEVPPFLVFCLGESITNYDCTTATDPFSDLGYLTPNLTSAAQNQMVVATNAQNGYSLWASGPTMTSGNNTINPMAAVIASQPGTSQFGMNLRANQTPSVGQDVQGIGTAAVAPSFNQPNRFFFHSGDIIASSPSTDAYRKYTVSYIVNIPKTQPGGVYSTTLTYVCLANF
jgi:hypothetical protein